MVITSTYRHCGVSPAQIVARRQVRMYLRKSREKEYCKLRALIPSVATKDKVTKVQVIEEAVRYIEELHTALLERFREKHDNMAEDKAQETVRTFVQRMMNQQIQSSESHFSPQTQLGRSNHGTFEKLTTQSSFLLRKGKNH